MSYSFIDDFGRATKSWTDGLYPTELFYDQYGRIESVRTGVEGDLREYQYLMSIALPDGEAITYTYDPATGKVHSVTSPDGETLTYAYDGSLALGYTLTGPVSGSVSQTYNNDFQVKTRSVNNANPVSFAYDADGLLDAAGALDLLLNPANGMPAGTSIGNVTTAITHNGFGELESESYSVSGSTLYEEVYSRDYLGRITSKTETIGGETTTYSYDYDMAGRLTRVFEDSLIKSTYDYDPDHDGIDNGNRGVNRHV